MRIRKGEKTQWEMFFEKVNKDGPAPAHNPKLGKCWLWTGSSRAQGHGYFWYDGVVGCAHRFSWLASGGEIPDGLHVLHKCDNGRCVNPDHLFLGTHDDNMQDMIRKGRQRDSESRSKQMTGEGNHQAKLTEDDVRKIRAMRAQTPRPTIQSISNCFGASHASVKSLLRGKTWKSVK